MTTGASGATVSPPSEAAKTRISVAALLRTLNVGIGRRVAGGSARLTLTLKDAEGNVKVLRRKLSIPS